MSLVGLAAKARKLVKPYRVSDGRGFRLDGVDPGDTGPFENEDAPLAREWLKRSVDELSDLQSKLYAQDRWALLLIFQAMDAAGKDGAIKHVMSGVNPQGCQVFSFKAPSQEELDHDFLWRAASRLPERGRIGIFNRSYYEEVLVVRVHPEHLQRQRLPAALVTKRIWMERYQDIRSFERYLSGNGVLVRKFFLHVSKEEQKRRFLTRMEDPEKNWKFSAADVAERQHWDAYQDAYADMLSHTSTPWAPWYVIPADHKWFARIAAAAVIANTLIDIDPRYPAVDRAGRRELLRFKSALDAEAPGGRHPRGAR